MATTSPEVPVVVQEKRHISQGIFFCEFYYCKNLFTVKTEYIGSRYCGRPLNGEVLIYRVYQKKYTVCKLQIALKICVLQDS